MKKILILIFVLFITSPAFAVCNYTNRCAPKAYDLSSRGGQIFSTASGMTFASEQLAQFIIGKELKKATKESFKVRVKSYSAMDLAHGRFKSMVISGKNLDIDGIYLSSLSLKTLCDFNYVDLSSKDIKFKENIVMGFSTEISETDLRKTMQSSGYLDMLKNINLSAFGVTFFKITGADVKINNNKLYMIVKISSQLFLTKAPTDVIVGTDIKVEEGRIVLTKIDLVNLFTRIDLSKMTYLLNAINPLTFTTDILNNKKTQTSIQSVDIIGNKILIGGQIFIPKNLK